MLKIIEAQDTAALAARLKDRGSVRFPEQECAVRAIVEDVENRGDEAVFAYTREFDHFDVNPGNLIVSEQEIQEAYVRTPKEIRDILVEAAANIEAFHIHQRRDDWFIERPDGSFLGQRYLPVERAAVYVPGGTASYPSSVLMNIIPAKVAGVPNICVATPATDGRVEPVTIVAAHVAGRRRSSGSAGRRRSPRLRSERNTSPGRRHHRPRKRLRGSRQKDAVRPGGSGYDRGALGNLHHRGRRCDDGIRRRGPAVAGGARSAGGGDPADQ